MSSEKKPEIGYKGFDLNLQCRKMQFEVGKEYAIDPSKKLKCCPNESKNEAGLHYCEHPLNVFNYYAPAQSRFCEVENRGEIDKSTDGDTKVASSRLFIKAEIGFKALIEAGVKFVFDRANWTVKENHATGDQGAASATGDQGAASATGYQGAASATGYQGAASATGNRGAASATGYQGAASATGDQGAASATGNRGAASATGDQGAASATGANGTAIALGIQGKAKGIKGNYLVLAEWQEDLQGTWKRRWVKTFEVDGKKVKENTYYTLSNGKLKEVKDA